MAQSELTKLNAVAERSACLVLMSNFYYIDSSIVLKNTPLVKFIRSYIQDQSDIFFPILTYEVFDGAFSTFHGCLCKQSVCQYDNKEITWWLEDTNFIFSC